MYQGSPPKLEISSLIDICFLLLIYFLATSTLVPRENDLRMQLPRPMDDVNAHLGVFPMFIRIDANGAIFTGVGRAQVVMDTNAEDRAVPLLSSQLDLYASAARGASCIPLVQIHVDDNAMQQRMIDVLNALAKARIQHVTFTDILEM